MTALERKSSRLGGSRRQYRLKRQRVLSSPQTSMIFHDPYIIIRYQNLQHLVVFSRNQDESESQKVWENKEGFRKLFARMFMVTFKSQDVSQCHVGNGLSSSFMRAPTFIVAQFTLGYSLDAQGLFPPPLFLLPQIRRVVII